MDSGISAHAERQQQDDNQPGSERCCQAQAQPRPVLAGLHLRFYPVPQINVVGCALARKMMKRFFNRFLAHGSFPYHMMS